MSLLYSLDSGVLQLINQSFHTPLLNSLALLVSYMGVIYFGLAVVLLLYLSGDKKRKHVALVLLVSLILTFIVVHTLKICVMRPRPYTVMDSLVVLAHENDYSFPSGHTAIATCIAWVLARNYGNYKYFMLIPFMVALSRLYLGVHYPSDVICGFICGMVIALLVGYLDNNH